MLEVPSDFYMYGVVVLLWLLLVLLVLVVACCAGRLEHRSVQRWAADKGKIVINRYSDEYGWQISVEPAHSHVRRVDLQSLSSHGARGYSCLRIRVHLAGGTGFRFVATAWDSPHTRPVSTDEGPLGIESIDERFSVETSNLKETVAVLGDPTLSEMLAKNKPLREVEVADDRIDLLYDPGAVSLIPMVLDHFYDLSLALATRMSELIEG
jgi:hypothetical protein